MLTPLGAMRLAITEARKGLGFVSPNPPVGCVIVGRDGNFLAKGYHRKFGGDHAEIDALKQIRDQKLLEGATFYVTLEPCAHIGKTPSCAAALAKLPIAKVVYGLVDPNPLVAGRGLEILKKAKIAVEPVGDLVEELEDLAEAFLLNQREKKSFVTVKVATTLDGQMAHSSGESQWLTGEEAREYAQYLRGIHDAVMVGAETFRKDNPQLNVRHSKFENKSNYAIVVNAKGDLLDAIKDSALVRAHEPGRVIVAVGETLHEKPGEKSARQNAKREVAANDAGIQVWRLPERNGLIDLNALFKKAFDSGLSSIFVEGGARLVSNIIAGGYAHRLCQFIAPQLLGPKSGLSFTQSLVSQSFSERTTLQRPVWVPIGPDVLLTGRFGR